MMKTNFFGKALAIAMMLLGLTFVSCDEFDNPLPADWDGVSPNLPLTLEAVNEGATMNVTFTSTLPETTTIEYSTDGGKSWHFFTISGGKPDYYNSDYSIHYDDVSYQRTISSVHQILIKGQNETYGSTYKGDLKIAEDEVGYMPIRKLYISVNADCYIYGNMMSLVDGDNYATRTDLKEDYTFYGMFAGYMTNLKSHPTKKLLLPATTLTKGCYSSLFEGRGGITVAPDLPATTLAESCYERMFVSTGLKVAPSLPATKLAKYCCSEMFVGCTALTTAPDELPATEMTDSCYNEMFSGCTALTKAPKLPATKLAKCCYDNMFSGTALTTAPALPATTLADYCYKGMFSGCNALTTAPDLPATTLAESCYYFMFNGCTALTKAPVLPATELKSNCYAWMFSNCSNLNYIKCLATSIADGATDFTFAWISGISNSGTFVVADKNEVGTGKFWDPSPASIWDPNKCAAPAGWIVKNPDEE